MPNDAKLGLIVGVGVVVLVAVVFFRKDAGAAAPVPGASSAASVGAAPPPDPRVQYRQVRGRTNSTGEPEPAEGRRHTVAEGETLFSLAVRYYGDKSRFTDIYLANRSKVQEPDQLTPGTVLVIPEPEADPPPTSEAEADR